jgi:hypothetical protein
MEFHSMSLNELKAYCAKLPKGRRIKHYYIKSRAELCYLLSLPELPKEMQIEKLTIHDLRKMAKDKNVRGIWGLSKGELQDLLFPEHQEWDTSTVSTMQKDHQNQDDAKKHHGPQNADSKKVGTKQLK